MRSPRIPIFGLIALLLAACLIGANRSEAQTQDCDFPPLIEGSYVWSQSWEPGATVRVFIDDRYNETDFNQLKRGILNWNYWREADCSYVTFQEPEPKHFTQAEIETEMPPDYTVWVQINSACSLGCVDAKEGPLGRAIGAKIMIHPNTVNSPNAWYYSYVASHEIGHTFGLTHPDSFIRSVMAGPRDSNWNANLPTSCDAFIVSQLYCQCTPVDCSQYCEDCHWEDATCSCEPDDLEGCDPADEWACYQAGGTWDPYFCDCNLGCDPYGQDEAWCYSVGGMWDPTDCSCYQEHPCNPGPYYGTQSGVTVDYDYCNSWTGTVWNCHGSWVTWTSYCWDGSIYHQYEQYTESCNDTFAPCDGSGGGGGGGGYGDPYDCWWNGDCSCDFDWGICCDDFGCWDEEERSQ